MAKPIPKKLLCHDATLYRNSTRDAWGAVSALGAATVLGGVRFQPSEKLVINRDNKQTTLRLEMLFDCVNSTPGGTTFRLGDMVEYDGDKYTVEAITRAWDESKLHHWEIGLV